MKTKVSKVKRQSPKTPATPADRRTRLIAAETKSPFVWFGGKRRVATLVWDAIGDVDNYVEPFAGSLAVLLGRPAWHKGGAETVNDADAYLSNFWRALAADSDDVAAWCDWPVNETDLIARHLWLVNTGRERIARMESDPDFYDAKVAGWWVWGVNAWIGSGWCSGKGPHVVEDGVICDSRQLPHLGNRGQGVNRQLPHLGDRGQDKPSKQCDNEQLADYFSQLADRLRGVRVCCGDWSRVVTDGALAFGDCVGVFLDPPYLGDVRAADLYSVDDHSISIAVREWALAHGDDKRMRIVLAGYEDEHAGAMPESWRVHAYSANRAYGSSNGESDNSENRHKERLWFSPHCRDTMPLLVNCG